ncbi:MAG: sodium:proton antiporter NhaD [Gammaproteobacteria bacterium]
MGVPAQATQGALLLDLTGATLGFAAVGIFVLAYGLVICEEIIELRKSKPVIVAAGVIWMLAAIAYAEAGRAEEIAHAVRHNTLEFAELMLFLLAAMTYVNTLEERNIFKALRSWLAASGFSLRAVFWLTGLLAFFMSPIADNLTTALVMGAVVMAVGAGQPAFVAAACINIVVAANAGGAFSPFGDITTLMVWQKGTVAFGEFLALFLPAAVNWLVPAAIISLSVRAGRPAPFNEVVAVKPGGYVVIVLFVATIAMTVALHHFAHLPPFLGMMTGLGLLKVYGYVIRRAELRRWTPVPELDSEALSIRDYYKPAVKPFDIFISMKRIEWDTLMFFYGVMLCVGGLGAFGYLALVSQTLYVDLGPTAANILVGVASAVIDNIPIMFAVLTMNPEMSLGQWLLVTLTAGVGGSLLSIGSAAGVALMGQAREVYTFFAHLKWTWAVALGYAASIAVHFEWNAHTF